MMIAIIILAAMFAVLAVACAKAAKRADEWEENYWKDK